MDQGTKLIANGQRFDRLIDKDGNTTTDLLMATAYARANLEYSIKQGDQIVFRQYKQF
jgi:hypothetical protein